MFAVFSGFTSTIPPHQDLFWRVQAWGCGPPAPQEEGGITHRDVLSQPEQSRAERTDMGEEMR